MKGVGHFIVTFLYLAVMAWVIAAQFIEWKVLLYATCGFSSLVISWMIFRKVQQMPFTRYFLIITFLTIITIPLIGPKSSVSLENRQLMGIPEFRISNPWKFLKEFKNYYEDRFAYRNLMLEFIGRIKLWALGVSPVPDKVEVGIDNWLFSSGDYYVDLTSIPLTQNELKLVETNLEIITLWLAERGIRFYYVCLPVKSRIYPDKMPEALRRLNEFSRLDQVYTYLRKNKRLNIIDVREELINGRKTRDTYLKNDTHWNSYGALMAYFKIMKEVSRDFPGLVVSGENMFHLDSAIKDSGDLLKLMGLDSGAPAYHYQLKLTSGPEPMISDSTVPGGFRNYVLVSNYPQSANKLKIFVIRDSMTDYMTLALSSSFTRSFYLWQPLPDIRMIEAEKPDIVLHEMQELFISHLLRLPAEIRADSVFMNRHFPDYDITESVVDFNNVTYF